MCTAGPNDNLWLTDTTRMDTNGYEMLNDSSFALFWTTGGVVGPRGSNMKNWKFCVVVIFEIKISVFACLLSSEKCDSFLKHVDLALAPNKINEEVKKQ